MTINSTILPRLHQIEIPLGTTHLDLEHVHVYLAEGDPLTLIDCGVATEESQQVLVDGLAARGYRVRDIQRLIITHHHVDHCGLASYIVGESGAAVWTHPYTHPWLEDFRQARLNLKCYTDVAFHEGGVPQAIIDTMEQGSEYLERLNGGSVPVDRTLDEGDLIEMAGHRWQVYHTPGHAGGMICFYQPENRVLLSSDHLLRDVSSNPLIEAPDQSSRTRPKRLLDYMREMQRMTALDVQIAYPGHGDPITDITQLVESRLAFHQKRANKLYGLFDGQPRYLYELTQMMFPTVPNTLKYLTLSEVLGHIDILERDGRLVREMQDGVLFWHPVEIAQGSLSR